MLQSLSSELVLYFFFYPVTYFFFPLSSPWQLAWPRNFLQQALLLSYQCAHSVVVMSFALLVPCFPGGLGFWNRFRRNIACSRSICVLRVSGKEEETRRGLLLPEQVTNFQGLYFFFFQGLYIFVKGSILPSFPIFPSLANSLVEVYLP